MAQIQYELHAFNSSEAASGKLCVMTTITSISSSSPYTTIKNIDDYGSPVAAFGGAGICRVTGSNEYTLKVNGINYAFNHGGKPANAASRNGNWLLYRASIIATIVSSGVDVVGTTSGQVTRGNETTDPEANLTYGEAKGIVVDSLNPRDQFAAQALRGLLSHIEDPTGLSNDEMQQYCEVAYQWAANMMTAAANTRVIVDDGSATSTATEVEIGSLESNTEKLLNNIVYSLQRTDVVSASGTWSKQGQTSVTGAYTDAIAQTLPKSGGGYCSNIADAEADGWEWKPAFCSERISNPELNNLITNFLLHTDGSTATSRKFDDLLTALANIQSAISTGGGGGSSFDGNILSMPDVNIGSSGIGRDSNHPIYISGGGFPTKSALAAEFYGDTAHGQVNKAEDFVAFNYNGAVGYITADELVKRMNINTLISSALSAKLAGAYVEVGGTRYNVVFPNV